MRKQEIIDIIKAGAGLFGFEYNGKECHVDPYYDSKEQKSSYLLYCDGNETTVYSVEEVMTTAFFGGKSLDDIAKKITQIEY